MVHNLDCTYKHINQIIMKKLLLYTIFLGFLICDTSCKKIDQLLTFTISNEDTLTIPATNTLNLPISFLNSNNTTNSSEAFANNNTDANHVKNIYLKNLQLTITSPAGQNFNFLQSINIYISTDSSNEILLASLNTIPQNVITITLTPTQAALDMYIKAPSYNLRTEVTTDQNLSQNVNIVADSKFQVTAVVL
jgi:hypothetical protein